MKFTVNADVLASGTLPNTPLNSIVKFDPKDVKKTRSFELVDFLFFGNMGINGMPMKFDYINEYVKLGELEKWHVTAEGHPFHIHGVSFQVLSINGQPPAAHNRGWKDTYYVAKDGDPVFAEARRREKKEKEAKIKRAQASVE